MKTITDFRFNTNQLICWLYTRLLVAHSLKKSYLQINDHCDLFCTIFYLIFFNFTSINEIYETLVTCQSRGNKKNSKLVDPKRNFNMIFQIFYLPKALDFFNMCRISYYGTLLANGLRTKIFKLDRPNKIFGLWTLDSKSCAYKWATTNINYKYVILQILYLFKAGIRFFQNSY